MESKELNWPGWEIVEIIGRGSFGVVYRIQRQVHGHMEYAALKVICIPQNSSEIAVLRADGYDDASITRYFADSLGKIENEYAIMVEMKGHSNIVHCEDIRKIQHDDGFGWDIYIKMELLTPLKKSLAKGYGEKDIIKLGIDLCNALVLCSRLNIVHRDIKPENIFISRDGSYKLGDFGIARTMEGTTSGTKVGTYEYMAPEVYNNQPYHNAADIYSLGLVMYWLMNNGTGPFLPQGGQKPTPTAKSEARGRRFAGEPIPEPVNGSRELKQIVMKAIQFQPERRYRDPALMKQDLESLLYRGYLEQSQPEPEVTVPEEPETATVRAEQNPDPGEKTEAIPVREESEQQNVTPKQEENPKGEPRKEEKPQQARKSSIEPKQNLKKQRRKFTMVLVTAAAVVILIAALSWKSWLPHTHQWMDASCTAPLICKLCGDTVGEPLDHTWQERTCEEPKTCTVCGVQVGTALGHSWVEANCESPQTCSVCGATEGEGLGHSWIEATCETPKTCATCGITEGTVAEHLWQPFDNDSTQDCVVVCRACGAKEKLAAQHTWKPATLSSPKRCSACGKMTGTSLPKPMDADGYAAGINLNGMVIAADSGNGWLDCAWNYAKQWNNIAAVSTGKGIIVGLQKNGTVLSGGTYPNGGYHYEKNRWDENLTSYRSGPEVENWKNIVAIDTGENHVVGLTADGTVMAQGNNDQGQCNVEDWKNVVMISASGSTTIGLRSDGTIVGAGVLPDQPLDQDKWSNIVSISAGPGTVVGVRADGTVAAASVNADLVEQVSTWTDIAAVDVGEIHVVGIKSDGTVIAIPYGEKTALAQESGQCQVSDWTDIVAVEAGPRCTIGLKPDGTIVTAGAFKTYSNWKLKMP